jgi:hypothetical protein
MKKILILIAIFAFTMQAGEKVIHRDQQKWIDKTIKILKKFKPTNKTKYVKMEKSISRGGDTTFYYDIKNRGVIKVGDNGWLAIVCHSFHQDETTNIDIGDIILAIDENGNLYRNDGHPCLSIRLYTSSKGFQNLDDFLATTVLKNKKWYKLKDEK